jgi:hypothetical protein
VRNILIKSNNRTFFCNPETGVNIGGTRYGTHVIARFDLEEFKAAHGNALPAEIDIIDVGYWYHLPTDGPMHWPLYEPPVWHTREAAAA